jgi:hypothetical protein
VLFPWESPRFDSALGQRQLRILNAIFLGVARVGGKGQAGGGDRLELDVHGADPERIAWEDSEEVALEALITDIAVELITTAEINYRDACTRPSLGVGRKGGPSETPPGGEGFGCRPQP